MALRRVTVTGGARAVVSAYRSGVVSCGTLGSGSHESFYCKAGEGLSVTI